VARRLISQGAPISVAVSFLLAAPTINPVVIWATWTAFRDQPEIVVLRVVLSLANAVIISMIFSTQKDLRPILKKNIAIALPAPKVKAGVVPTGTFFLGEDRSQPLDLSGYNTESNQIITKSLPDRLNLLLDNTLAEMRELGAILVFGSAIAAIIQVWVPRDIILNLGQGPISSIVSMMILAAIVSICSTVDAFFALSFYRWLVASLSCVWSDNRSQSNRLNLNDFSKTRRYLYVFTNCSTYFFKLSIHQFPSSLKMLIYEGAISRGYSFINH
jgi:uncharacterized membrane protein YraQ (UPF0718 family)